VSKQKILAKNLAFVHMRFTKKMAPKKGWGAWGIPRAKKNVPLLFLEAGRFPKILERKRTEGGRELCLPSDESYIGSAPWLGVF
jgi:hypothetical protein